MFVLSMVFAIRFGKGRGSLVRQARPISCLELDCGVLKGGGSRKSGPPGEAQKSGSEPDRAILEGGGSRKSVPPEEAWIWFGAGGSRRFWKGKGRGSLVRQARPISGSDLVCDVLAPGRSQKSESADEARMWFVTGGSRRFQRVEGRGSLVRHARPTSGSSVE